MAWKTTTKRYVPTWKTRPVSWRQDRMTLTDEINFCGCGHGRSFHFIDPGLPFIFCLVADCECVVDQPPTEIDDGSKG